VSFYIYLKIPTKRSKPFPSFAKTFCPVKIVTGYIEFYHVKFVQVLYMILFNIVQKKCQKKGRRKNAENKSVEKVKKRKCWKERSKLRLLVCTSVWTFISICVTRLLSSFWCNFARWFFWNQSSLAYSLFASNLKFVFCACVVTSHLSYLVISTRHWISSLDCYLSSQQLEFRFLLLFIPCQAPHKSHRVRFSNLVFVQLSLLFTTNGLP
jgi:hypothetical protein